MDVKLNYASSEVLTPGQDDTLDDICNYLIEGRPLYDPPNEVEQARTTADEDTFLELLEQSPNYLRNAHYDRWLPRLDRLKRLSRSTKNVLQHIPLGAGDVFTNAGRAIYRPFMEWFGRRV